MTSAESVVRELLEENKVLRIKLAVLQAKKRQYDEIERQFSESKKGITEEVWNKISPAAQQALMNMEFK